MPASATRSELLEKRLDRFSRVLRDVAPGDVPDLHDARVASRRLRELVPVLQIENNVARKLNRRLRKVTDRLGTVRELDVLALLIDELQGARPRGRGALARVGVQVAQARDEARKRLLARMPVVEMSRVARRLERVAGDLRKAEGASSKAAARSWRWAIEARVARRASRLSIAMDEAGALYVPERLHAVRVAVKKLRYAVEVAAEAMGAADGVDLRTLQRGQDLLDRLHDLQVLIDRVRRAQALLTPPRVTVWREFDTLIGSLEDECRRLHARYVRMRGALEGIAERRSASGAAAPGAQKRSAG